MLPLGRQGAISGDHGPAILEGAASLAAGIEDRFHRQGHPGPQGHVGQIPGAEIEHGGFFVQIPAHPVARVVLHHGIAMGLHVVLHSAGNIEQGVASLDLGEPLHQGFLGHPGESLGIFRGPFPNAEADAAIAVVPIEKGPGIQLQQVAGMDHPLAAGDAMDDFVVNACANAGRESVIPLEAGSRAHLADALFGVAIEVAGGHARGSQLHEFPQHGGHNAAGFAHRFQLAG